MRSARFHSLYLVLVVLLGPALVWAQTTETPTPQLLSNESPVYQVPDEPEFLHFVSSFSGRNPRTQEREISMDIYPEVLRMIEQAEHSIIGSAFLFDSLYADVEPELDIVKKIKEALEKKIRKNPSIQIAIILDPSHRAYADRVSPTEKALRELGADFFYTDLLSSTASTRFRVWERVRKIYRRFLYLHPALPGISARIFRTRLPFDAAELDGHRLSLRSLTSAGLVKANHRKILVTDTGKPDSFEALMTSANPHNASIPSWNHAFVFSGPAATYVYGMLREDIAQSIELGERGFDFVHWGSRAESEPGYQARYLKELLPEIPVTEFEAEGSDFADSNMASVQIITEEKVKLSILRLLSEVEADDEIRIQMFYLSDTYVIEAILEAAAKVDKPIRILLDPNKDAFNQVKDGTPNRQVAKYLMEEAKKASLEDKIQIRWALTMGEQNHAKSMSIVNKRSGKSIVMGGSANWTRRNLGTLSRPINWESNVLISSQRVAQDFNQEFDILYGNLIHPRVGHFLTYSVKWDDPAFNFHYAAANWKWSLPPCMRALLTLKSAKHPSGRGHRLERTWTMF